MWDPDPKMANKDPWKIVELDSVIDQQREKKWNWLGHMRMYSIAKHAAMASPSWSSSQQMG